MQKIRTVKRDVQGSGHCNGDPHVEEKHSERMTVRKAATGLRGGERLSSFSQGGVRGDRSLCGHLPPKAEPDNRVFRRKELIGRRILEEVCVIRISTHHHKGSYEVLPEFPGISL